jgi:hypothetical protein
VRNVERIYKNNEKKTIRKNDKKSVKKTLQQRKIKVITTPPTLIYKEKMVAKFFYFLM